MAQSNEEVRSQELEFRISSHLHNKKNKKNRYMYISLNRKNNIYSTTARTNTQ
jgi:hypothetical protein